MITAANNVVRRPFGLSTHELEALEAALARAYPAAVTFQNRQFAVLSSRPRDARDFLRRMRRGSA